MAVRSTVADSINNMFTTLAKVPQNLQQSQLNNQKLEDNQYALDRRNEADIMAKVEGAGNYRITSTDPNAAYDTYDFYRLAKEQPELAASVLNRDPAFNVAVDEKGRKIQTKVSGFDINPDTGDVVVKVMRPDGREVPVTQNRTAQDDDVVVRFNKDDFQKFGQNTMRQMTAIGAGANNNTFRRDANLLIEQAIKQRTLESVKNSPIAQDPGALTNIGAIVTNADTDSVAEIAADQGVDVSAVETEVVDQLEQSGNYSAETIADARENGINSVQAAVDKKVDEATKPANASDRRRNARKDQVAENRLRKIKALEKEIAITEANREKLNKVRAAKDKEPFDFGDRDNLPGKREELQKLRAEAGIGTDSQEPNQQSPLAEVASDAVKNISTKDDMATAIANPETEPTEQDYQATGQLLQQYGVTSKEELYKLPSEDLMRVSFMMASRQGGSVEDKLKVANQLVNMGLTGSTDKDAADMATLGVNKGNLEVRQREYAQSVQDSLKDQIDGFNEAMLSSIDALSKVKAMSVDEDGDPIAPSPEMSVEVGAIWDKSMSLLGDERVANQSIALEATMYHMQSIQADSSPGWLDFSDRLENWFNQNGQIRIGSNSLSGLLRAEIDPKTNKAKAFYFRDANGGKINFPMSPEKFKDVYGSGPLTNIEKLAIKNTTRERAAAARSK